MTEKIKQIIIDNWSLLPVARRVVTPQGTISLTKFHHGQASEQAKVLFLATYEQAPICLIKTGRGAAADEKIRREKEWQAKFAASPTLAAPRVYFDGQVNGRYFYAEEVITGRPLSVNLAERKEKEIIERVKSFDRSGEISSKAVADIFLANLPPGETVLVDLISALKKSEVVLPKGFSHGDLTRKNILLSAGQLRLIDWERAGQRPFWLLDAVHFMVTGRNIKTFFEWQEQTRGLFIDRAKISAALADALYCLEAILETFCKKYPVEYSRIIEQLSQAQ